MRSTHRVAVAVASLAFAQVASALPIVFYGNGSTTASAQTAHDAWASAFPDRVTDQLDGLAGVGGNLTSALGNNFTTTDQILVSTSSPGGVIDGTSLQLQMTSSPATFTWTLATASNAFGFFGFDNDDGDIMVSFVDGNNVTHAIAALDAGTNIFWGISGLDSLVTSVTISTTDPGGVSYWDRFVYVPNVTTVPEPSTLALLGLGLAGLGFARRRRATH